MPQHAPPGTGRRRRMVICLSWLAAAALLPGFLALPTAQATAAATTSHIWIARGSWIDHLGGTSPATASYFFNTPASFSIASPAGGFTATPVAYFRSYADFQAAVPTLSPSTYPWVAYDPESWTWTPPAEQQNPEYYMQAFGELAHSLGFKVMMIPARDLAATDATCPNIWRSYDKWYVNCQIAAYAVMDADGLWIQSQSDTTSPTRYAYLVNSAQAQAHTQNPAAWVVAGLSTSYGTPTQAAAAATSVTVQGYGFMLGGSTAGFAWWQNVLSSLQQAGY